MFGWVFEEYIKLKIYIYNYLIYMCVCVCKKDRRTNKQTHTHTENCTAERNPPRNYYRSWFHISAVGALKTILCPKI